MTKFQLLFGTKRFSDRRGSAAKNSGSCHPARAATTNPIYLENGEKRRGVPRARQGGGGRRYDIHPPEWFKAS